MAAVTVATIGGALLGGTLYLDGKLQVSGDLSSLRRIAQGEQNFRKAVLQGRGTLFDLFEETVKRLDGHEAIWTRDCSLTWAETYRHVCQYARYFRSRGVKTGDFVALYVMNRPEFVFCWLSLLAIGASPALINYNLIGTALWHCVKISSALLLVVDADESCQQRVQTVRETLVDAAVEVIVLDGETKSTISSLTADPPSRELRQRRNTPLGLMYTSGTTGLPKAFAVGIERAYYSASVHRKTFGQVPGPSGDRTYHCMPLYHGTGGIAALIDLIGGLSIALAPKFSVSRFWLDCIESGSTISLYVGETARYLLAAPPSPTDKAHKIRLMWGNGMSTDVWKKFQARFGITEIGEFFASTEGMLTLVNHSRNDLSLGAVGHHGWLLRQKYADTYVSVCLDVNRGGVRRDPITGFVKQTPLEEGGEILVRIPSKKAWPGYWGAEDATNSRFLENVFEEGDLFYRTGDALRRTKDGYWYFLDRLGDTYRWKGETVSTTEVSQILGMHPMIADANVYGVRVPGHDGKAGCVALVLSELAAKETWARTLASYARAKLPKNAVPAFLRVLKDSAEMKTDNNKHLKAPLQFEGVEPGRIGTKVKNGDTHAMYWLKAGAEEYTPFTENHWLSLQSGRAKL